MKKPVFLGFLLAMLLLFSACAPDSGSNLITEELPTRLTPEAYKIAVFADGEPEGFWARHDRGNGPPFDCSFQRANARIEDGLLQLWLTQAEDGIVGAEYRTWNTFHYGYYSVSMQAAKGDGIISSFFLYTGWPWDEIDIEFLGNDTTKVQFNYYHNGNGGHEYLYDLGFDASEGFHEYGFDWQEDAITWYVDGKAVYRATKDIPSTPGHIMVNLWNVAQSNAGWAGSFDPGQLPVTAKYQWFGYQSAA